MTERLYYLDSFHITFDASVTRSFTHDGRPAVLLDRSAFYPASGGQPFDVGRLGPARVLEVVDLDDGDVVHVLDVPLEEGDAVQGEIDWTRRLDHMQQHTGQHLLSAAFARVLQVHTNSFHMSADVSTIDLAREVSPEEIARAEDEANRVVWEDRAVRVRFASAEEAAALPLRKEPVRGGALRLVEVADFDLSACGGTHVGRTGTIGVIAVTAWERFRGGSRVYFVCGGRALRTFRTYRDAVAGSTRTLSVLPGELPAAVERAQTEAKDLRRTIKGLQEALAVHEAARLAAGAATVAGTRVVAAALDGWDAAGLKAVASSLSAETGLVVALFSTAPPVTAVIARSQDARVDANVVLKALIARFGGRGGGKPDLAQGGGLSADVPTVLSTTRAIIEEQLQR